MSGLGDAKLLEKSRITVEDDGKAFRVRGVVIPFDAILHIELATNITSRLDRGRRLARGARLARIITDDRLHDPVLMEMGVRASSSDGEPPEFDASLLVVRVKRIAEAAARVSGKRVTVK